MESDASAAACTSLQAQLKDASAKIADLQARLDQAQAEITKLTPKAKK
jgi:peptidoglycan hydrolase CwlO-like protein